MAITFLTSVAVFNANAATVTSPAFTPAFGESIFMCGEQFAAGAAVFTGTPPAGQPAIPWVVDVAQTNTSGGGANGSNSIAHLLQAQNVSQTITIASAGGTFEAGFGVRYIGISAVTNASQILVAAPGTGANGISGTAQSVPVGSKLLFVVVDISNGPTTITSSNASRSVSSVTNGTGVFNFFEFDGAGASITPLATTTTGGDDYMVGQWLLTPGIVSIPLVNPIPRRRRSVNGGANWGLNILEWF